MSEFKWEYGHFDSFFGYEENAPDIDKLLILKLCDSFCKNNGLNEFVLGTYNGTDFVVHGIDYSEYGSLIKNKRVLMWSYIPEVENG